MSAISRSRGEWYAFSSMITFSAHWRKVGALPMPVVRYTRPSRVISVASTTAKSIDPRNPSITACATCERCMSTKSSFPVLASSRIGAEVMYGARQLTASARPSSSSQAAPVDAPLSSLTWNASPAWCNSRRAWPAPAAPPWACRPG